MFVAGRERCRRQNAQLAPQQRAKALGMSAAMLAEDVNSSGYTTLGLNEANQDLSYDPIGTYFSVPLNSTVLNSAGIGNVDLSMNKAGHIENNHFQDIPSKSQFAPILRSHEALVANVITPVLQNPYAVQFNTKVKNSNGQIEVNFWGNLPFSAGTDTQRVSTRSVKASMWWTPGSATIQVKNAFPVTQGQGN